MASWSCGLGVHGGPRLRLVRTVSAGRAASGPQPRSWGRLSSCPNWVSSPGASGPLTCLLGWQGLWGPHRSQPLALLEFLILRSPCPVWPPHLHLRVGSAGPSQGSILVSESQTASDDIPHSRHRYTTVRSTAHYSPWTPLHVCAQHTLCCTCTPAHPSPPTAARHPARATVTSCVCAGTRRTVLVELSGVWDGTEHLCPIHPVSPGSTPGDLECRGFGGCGSRR